MSCGVWQSRRVWESESVWDSGGFWETGGFWKCGGFWESGGSYVTAVGRCDKGWKISVTKSISTAMNTCVGLADPPRFTSLDVLTACCYSNPIFIVFHSCFT